MKYTMLLVLLVASSSLFASDRPVWTIDNKKWNLPQRTYGQKGETMVDPYYIIQFTPDDKILISFFDRRPQTELATKDTPESSGHVFVVLLLSRETGELIRRVEWPVMGESVPVYQLRHGSRIYPLASGGYVGIFNRRLQILGSSFNVIHDRVLETSEQKMTSFNIVVPLYGQFFIFQTREDIYTTEVIDSKTFNTVERLDVQDFHIWNVWEDRLLVTSYPDRGSDYEIRFFEKKIGVSQWNDLGLSQSRRATATFVHNGTIIITDHTGAPDPKGGFWFSISAEGDKKSDPVYKNIRDFNFSWNTSVVAVRTGHLSTLRSLFDRDSIDWIEAYDLSTQKVLFTTRRYSESNILNFAHAISPDGRSIVLMTRNRIELYTANPNNRK